jgi:hypothetical protein
LRLQQQDGAVALSNYYLTPWTIVPLSAGRRHSTHFEPGPAVVIFEDVGFGLENTAMGFRFDLTSNTKTTFQTVLFVPEDATYIDLQIHCGDETGGAIGAPPDNIEFTGYLAAGPPASFFNDAGQMQQISSVLHSTTNLGDRLYSDHHIITLRVVAADFLDPSYFPKGNCAISFIIKRVNGIVDNYPDIVSVTHLAIAAGR